MNVSNYLLLSKYIPFRNTNKNVMLVNKTKISKIQNFKNHRSFNSSSTWMKLRRPVNNTLNIQSWFQDNLTLRSSVTFRKNSKKIEGYYLKHWQKNYSRKIFKNSLCAVPSREIMEKCIKNIEVPATVESHSMVRLGKLCWWSTRRKYIWAQWMTHTRLRKCTISL